MIDPHKYGHYHRESNQEFSPGKPQDEHACQQGQEQNGNAEPEEDAYRNVHVRNRFTYIDLIEAHAICRTADYIQYEWNKCFHVIQSRTASFWRRQKNPNHKRILRCGSYTYRLFCHHNPR